MGNPATGIATPDEVEAGNLGVVLILARRDGREDEGFGIVKVLEVGGGGESGVDRFLDAEHEEEKEERGEELETGGPLVPP